MRMAEGVDLEGPRDLWGTSISMDDQLWMQSIASYRYLVKRGERRLSPDEEMLTRLMCVGLLDTSATERNHVVATRAMRYSANLADRLWGLVETERTRVESPLFLSC
jgi:hypothetical protein